MSGKAMWGLCMGVAVGLLVTIPARGEEGLPAELAQRFAQLDAAVRELPRQGFDLQAVVDQVGREPGKLAAWVQQNVAYEPYEGFMKGAVGTLVSGRGSSADKALLLAALVEAAGVKCQLVQGTIAGDALPKAGLAAVSAMADEAAALALGQKLGLSEEEAKAALVEGQVEGQRFEEELWPRTLRDLELVAGMLKGAGMAAPVAPTPAQPKQHWWVRVEGKDLDPTVAAGGGKAGKTLDLRKLPADQIHTVRLVLSIRTGGGPTTVLDTKLRVADMFGQTILVGNVPVDAAKTIASLKEAEGNKALEALAGNLRFSPQVVAGTQQISGKAFDGSGKFIKLDESNTAAVGGLGGGLGGMFSGGDDEGPKTPTFKITAQTLEIELAGPGVTPLKITRELLRSGTTGAQAAYDVLATHELLLLPEEISDAYITQLTLDYSRAWKEQLAGMIKGLKGGVGLSGYGKGPRFNARLYAFAAGRREGMRRLRESRFAEAVYVHSRPTLVSYTQRIIEGKPAKLMAGIDILHNEMMVVAGAVAGGAGGAGAGDWAGSFPLACGVLDTALEHVCMGAAPNSLNTSALLDRAMLAGAKPVLVRGAPPAELKLSAVAKAQMGADASAAYVVVPGEGGSPAAWYRVRGDSGWALGFVEGGGGQAASEYQMALSQAMQLKKIMEFYGDFFTCWGIGLAAPLAGDIENSRKEFLHCMGSLACKKVNDAIKELSGAKASNFIEKQIEKGVKSLWKDVCKKILKEAGL